MGRIEKQVAEGMIKYYWYPGDKREWKRAYREINDFERQLADAGAIVVKEPYDPSAGTGHDGGGMLIGTFSDPDGNYFQLGSPMDEKAMEEMQREMAARR